MSGLLNTITIFIPIYVYVAVFLTITPFVIQILYKFQIRHGVYHASSVQSTQSLFKSSNRLQSNGEKFYKKLYKLSAYYIIITILVLSMSLSLNSIGISFELGAMLGANWNNPTSILFLEGFLLLTFSVIRLTSLSSLTSSSFSNSDDFQDLSNRLNSYLFSFLLTSYLLFMYQVGRALFVAEINGFRSVQVKISIIIYSFILAFFIAIISETLLAAYGVADEVLISSQDSNTND